MYMHVCGIRYIATVSNMVKIVSIIINVTGSHCARDKTRI